MGDDLVSTRVSKQAVFDHEKMIEFTEGWGAYNVICLPTTSIWLLTTLLNFYGEFYNRYQNFESDRDIDQLNSETLLGLICPMACEEDFQALVAAVQGIGLTLIEIRDRIGDTDADLDVQLETIATNVEGVGVVVADLGLPDLIDKLEPMLNGVGVILGAPDIPENGS